MGGSFSNTSDIYNSINNDILSELENTCSAKCNASASGNRQIIGGNVGNITIAASCNASASCAMTNSADLAVKDIISNIADQEQKAVTDFMGDLQFTSMKNTSDITNSLSNHITQVSASTCGAVSNVNADNNFLYVKAGGRAGNYLIDAQGSANASCAMSNITKIRAYNSLQNSVTQKEVQVGVFAMAGIVIGVIILVIAVVFIVVSGKGLSGAMFSNHNTSTKQSNDKAVHKAVANSKIGTSAAATGNAPAASTSTIKNS
jgi:hypothetical protein